VADLPDRIAEVLREQWVPSTVVYGTDEPVGFGSVRDWATHAAEAVIAALPEWVGEPPFTSEWSEHMRSLLGRQVNITIDRDKPVTVRGTLLAFSEDGTTAVRGDDGFVTWSWPAPFWRTRRNALSIGRNT